MKSAEDKQFDAKQKEEQERLDAISKKNGGCRVIMLKVPKNDQYTEFAYGFIKYPDRTDISIAMTMKDTDPLKGKEIVLRNSWLEGDNEILEDTELFLSACTVLDEVIGVRQALVKKNWMNGR
jgi:hypothetical protein